MTQALRTAFAQTDYRVTMAHGRPASIRVGQPLPPELLALLPHAEACWGYITACNPGSTPRPAAANEHAQGQLLKALRACAPRSRIMSGIGVGAGGWSEPSLFVIDVPLPTLDALMRRFHQRAIVQGTGAGPAELHWNARFAE